MKETILSVRGLRTSFFVEGREARAVDGVSFDLAEGETLALVGESGSGKSVTALSLLRLLPDPPARILGGEAFFGARDLLRLPPQELRRIRGGEIAMVFQDPLAALNPVRTIGSQLVEACRAHRPFTRAQARARAVDLLRQVGIPDPSTRFHAYPHQLSGGMRQRALIAMALVCEPRILIADEPTTALDVTVQAQLIDLLRQLRESLGMSLLLITHDMGVVAELADRVAVVYAGRIVETGAVTRVFDVPLHPYTAGLFAARIPPSSPGGKVPLPSIPGEVPEPFAWPEGCRFRGRCPLELEDCARTDPPLREVGPGRASACLRVERGALPWAAGVKTPLRGRA